MDFFEQFVEILVILSYLIGCCWPVSDGIDSGLLHYGICNLILPMAVLKLGSAVAIMRQKGLKLHRMGPCR